MGWVSEGVLFGEVAAWIEPGLTPTQVVALIRDGADTSEDGRRHLLNPRRSVELLRSGNAGLSAVGAAKP